MVIRQRLEKVHDIFFEEFMSLCDWLRVIEMLINGGNSAHFEVVFFFLCV